MSWSYFIDESGQDGKNTPHIVYGGLGIATQKLDDFQDQVKELYKDCFGVAFDGSHELKGSNLLSTRKFKWAKSRAKLSDEERQHHAGRFLSSKSNGFKLSGKDFAGYGQACLLFVENLIEIVSKNCDVLALMASVEDIKKQKQDINDVFEDMQNQLFRKVDFVSDPAIYFDETDQLTDNKKRENLKEIMFEYTGFHEELNVNFLNSSHHLMIQITDIIIYVLNVGVNLYVFQNYPNSDEFNVQSQNKNIESLIKNSMPFKNYKIFYYYKNHYKSLVGIVKK